MPRSKVPKDYIVMLLDADGDYDHWSGPFATAEHAKRDIEQNSCITAGETLVIMKAIAVAVVPSKPEIIWEDK